MRSLRTVLLTLITLAIGAAGVAGIVIWGGLYNVASTEQHLQPVFTVLELAMRQSVRLRARDIQVPALDDDAQIVRGAQCFRDKCVQCHGAPGVAQGDIGKSMQPLPGPLVDAPHRWRPRELYWVTRHGIKMSGMPAWEFRVSEDDLWALVAFMGRLPAMTPAQYDAMTQSRPGAAIGERTEAASRRGPGPAGGAVPPPSCGPGPRARGPALDASVMSRPGAGASSEPVAADAPRAGDPRLGRRALYQYACNACHRIPGVTGAQPNVGPPLAGMARRSLIAGRLANTPENMAHWLLHTREVDPLTAMPQMGVTPGDARDIAAYLATLD